MNPLAESALRVRPEATALRWGEQRWSWRELDRRSAEVAAALRSAGVRAGDRVGVLAQNAPETVFLVHAAARAGFTLVLLNTRLSAGEWHAQLARARCVVCVAGDGFVLGADGPPPLSFAQLQGGGPGSDLDLDPDPDPGRALVLLYTSGTTGRPKGALLSLGALMAQARGTALHLGATPDDVHLCNLPLFHIGGLAMVFRTADSGSTLLLHERFDATRVLRDLAAERVTHLSLVATTLARLLDAAGAGPLRAPHLRILPVGGGPLPTPLLRRAEQLGLAPLGTYGLTEACSQVTTVPPAERVRAGVSSGRPLPGMEVRIVDEARVPLPAGQPGEIEVRGPTLMLGYDADPAATAASLRHGWLCTHDLGTLDAEGWLTVHARRTDLILSGGENVYPAEIEAALLGIDGVRDAGVVAEADPQWGQVPVAAVVLAERVTIEEVKAALAGQLARFKLPRRYVALPELPRNAAGKLDRARLKALLAG